MKLTEQQLLTHFLEYLREKYKENHSEILIGEEGKDPEFVIVPFKREKS